MIIDAHSHVEKDPQTATEEFALMDHRASHWWGRGKQIPKEISDAPLKHLNYLKNEELILGMDKYGIDKTVVFGLDMTKDWNTNWIPNEKLSKFVSQFPDKLIGFGSLAPITTRDRFNRSCLEEAERCVKDYGFRGFKLGPCYTHCYPDEKKLYPLYEKLVDLDVPLVIHQGGSTWDMNLKYANPVFLDEVAYDFPELKICIAHLGFPWETVTFTMMRHNPNLYADISALGAFRPISLCWDLVQAKEYGVIDKIMFGTDWPDAPQKEAIEFFQVRLNQIANGCGWPAFTNEEIDCFLGDNARAFLSL